MMSLNFSNILLLSGSMHFIGEMPLKRESLRLFIVDLFHNGSKHYGECLLVVLVCRL